MNGLDVPEPIQRQLASLLETLLGNCAPRPHHPSLSTTPTPTPNTPGTRPDDQPQPHQQFSLWTDIMTSEHLPKILDVFRGQKKASLCKELLELFKHHPATSDAILISSLFDIGRIIHDSVDSLTPEGDRKHTALLLCSFIQKIDCGRNLEQQLGLYVECRARFCNLDLVKERLILCVASLCARAHRIMKSKHNKKTGGFVKAALAYCHITVPSIADPFKRLQLLLMCADIALLNQCLPQTDTFLKAAIHLLPDLPASDDDDRSTDGSTAVRKGTHTEERLAGHLRVLLALLVVAPGHPTLGPFYILNGLLNALPKYAWQPTTGVQTRVYIDLLGLLCALSQRRMPYHIAQVDSNDELFGGSPEYMSELGEILASTMTEILKQLNVLGSYAPADSSGGSGSSSAAASAAKLSQVRCVLALVNQLGARFELSSPLVTDFLLKLLELVQQVAAGGNAPRGINFTKADQKHFTNTLVFLKTRASAAVAASQPSSLSQTSNTAVAPTFLPKINALLASHATL
jgi:hypothetical protein